MPLHLTIVLFLDQESHEEALVTEVTEDLLPQAKIPLFQLDHINSKKAQAMRKDRKRQQAKLRTNMDYPLLGSDKHQSDIVRFFFNQLSFVVSERKKKKFMVFCVILQLSINA